MSELEAFLRTSNRVWYRSTDLINKFGKDELNKIYVENKIEVRNGINEKVIKLICQNNLPQNS